MRPHAAMARVVPILGLRMPNGWTTLQIASSDGHTTCWPRKGDGWASMDRPDYPKAGLRFIGAACGSWKQAMPRPPAFAR
jgi:hypothetical protein